MNMQQGVNYQQLYTVAQYIINRHPLLYCRYILTISVFTWLAGGVAVSPINFF